MGGCHCSYRNCTVRTDGVTHMFHFPVFDKVRCHQWLVNAGRLEFLNLKVSQLRNRVICQHHFKDSDFMNYMKEKLKFNAVPQLDGPFCEPPKSSEKFEQDALAYDICLEDIENEILSLNEKKANYSVKYADFLTNGYTKADPLSLINANMLKSEKKNKVDDMVPDIFFKTEPPKEKSFHIEMSTDDMFQLNSTPLQSSLDKSTNSLALIPVVTHRTIDCQNQNRNEPSIDMSKDQIINQQSNIDSLKKIHIVSERTISDASIFEKDNIKLRNLKPVPPSSVLLIPNKYKQKAKNNIVIVSASDVSNVNSVINSTPCLNEGYKQDDIERKYQIVNETDLSCEIPIISLHKPTSTPLQVPTNNSEKNQPLKSKPITQSTMDSSPIKEKCGMSLLKTKMAPERAAIIQKKRNFNMKLRDMVESCLDKLETQDIKSNVNQQVIVTNKNARCKQSESNMDKTLDSLEVRLKTMEENLLQKIDQNAQKILNLKNTLLPEAKKRSISTQTSINEEVHKKYLYQEISKYLSPDANSLIYEELFINKYAQKTSKSPTASKRRKCR